MVVLVARHDVESHAAKLLLRRRHRQPEPADHQQCLLVSLRPGLVEIKMRHRPERLQVQLRPAIKSIKAPRHEMPPPVFLQQPTLAHRDPRGPRHQRIRILDHTVAFRICPLFVIIS